MNQQGEYIKFYTYDFYVMMCEFFVGIISNLKRLKYANTNESSTVCLLARVNFMR